MRNIHETPLMPDELDKAFNHMPNNKAKSLREQMWPCSLGRRNDFALSPNNHND